MRKIIPALFILSLIAFPFRISGARWEWQLAAGAWSLKPMTSPVTTAATKLAREEADQLLAPLLSKYTFFNFQPHIQLSSSGYFFTAAAWYKFAAEKFALGISASYLDFTLPFLLTAEQDLYLSNIFIAHIDVRGNGRIDMRTVMLKVQGRWRISHGRRISIFANFGLTLIPLHGDCYLPLTAKVDSILGSMELAQTESATIAQLRAENSAIPATILSPNLAVSLHYRLNKITRLFIEVNLSPGTFLSAGLAFGR
jgi:hypothetical protein